MEDFESWTRTEIATAQARVREMERALELFLTWRSGKLNAATAATPRSASNGHAPKNGHIKPAKRKRASKNDAIFRAFEEAGPGGLNQEDIQRVARDRGLNANPSALRALCWMAKQDGRLISLAPGRYATALKNEAAVKNSDPGETAAPARLDHNRHQEGDAGGGT